MVTILLILEHIFKFISQFIFGILKFFSEFLGLLDPKIPRNVKDPYKETILNAADNLKTAEEEGI
jgi:hypothetical protein